MTLQYRQAGREPRCPVPAAIRIQPGIRHAARTGHLVPPGHDELVISKMRQAGAVDDTGTISNHIP